MGTKYTCEVCDIEHENEDDWTEEKRMAEAKQNFPNDDIENDRASVCEDCFQKIMKRYCGGPFAGERK